MVDGLGLKWRFVAGSHQEKGCSMFPPMSTFRMEFKPVFLFIYIAGSIAGSASIILWTQLDPTYSDVRIPVVLIHVDGIVRQRVGVRHQVIRLAES